MAEKKHGTCTACEGMFTVLKDGTVRQHNGPGYRRGLCDGAGKPPLEVLPLTVDVLEVVVRRALIEARKTPDYLTDTVIAQQLQRTLAPRLREVERTMELWRKSNEACDLDLLLRAEKAEAAVGRVQVLCDEYAEGERRGLMPAGRAFVQWVRDAVKGVGGAGS